MHGFRAPTNGTMGIVVCPARSFMKGGANDQLANAQFAAWFGVSTELVVSLGHGTHGHVAAHHARGLAGDGQAEPRASKSTSAHGCALRVAFLTRSAN